MGWRLKTVSSTNCTAKIEKVKEVMEQLAMLFKHCNWDFWQLHGRAILQFEHCNVFKQHTYCQPASSMFTLLYSQPALYF